jgi:hypothetical protein
MVACNVTSEICILYFTCYKRRRVVLGFKIDNFWDIEYVVTTAEALTTS